MGVLVGGALGFVVVSPPPTSGGGLRTLGVHPYTLPRSAFNITDHNLTYATNGFLLGSIEHGSFSVSFDDRLAASGAVGTDWTESEIGLGPVPAGPDETNITPLLIVQEAASGLLRIEYIPFPMNDTYGFVVFDATIAPSGAAPFAGHQLTLTYVASAPPAVPYASTRPYGQTTGNLSVEWDGTPLVAAYPLAWASFGAFYAYGLETGGFAGGAVFANVTTLAPVDGPSAPPPPPGPVPFVAARSAGPVG